MRYKFILFSLLSVLVLTACTQNRDSVWKESDTFQIDNYTLRGEEQKIGFIDAAFKAGEEQKYMWHFWSEDKNLDGAFKVLAVKETDDDEILVFEAPGLGGSNNGADAHLPSTMSLPEEGMWRLDAYIDDRLYGSIFVRVI